MENLVPAICEELPMPVLGSCMSTTCASALVATGLGRDYVRAGLYDICIIVSLNVLSGRQYVDSGRSVQWRVRFAARLTKRRRNLSQRSGSRLPRRPE